MPSQVIEQLVALPEGEISPRFRSTASPLLLPFDRESPGPLSSFWFSIVVLEALLIGRVFFSLIGFTKTPFVWFLHAITGPIVVPFSDFFGFALPLAGAHMDAAAIAAIGAIAGFAWLFTAVYFEGHRDVSLSIREISTPLPDQIPDGSVITLSS